MGVESVDTRILEEAGCIIGLLNNQYTSTLTREHKVEK